MQHTVDCVTPNPIASPTSTSTYNLIVTDSNGCVAGDSLLVIVSEICDEVFVPSAFSPNKDGQNDKLYVRGNNCITSFTFEVFDRWGEKVYEMHSASLPFGGGQKPGGLLSQNAGLGSGWDGTFKSKELNSGIFSYSLSATKSGGKPLTMKGTIALLR